MISELPTVSTDLPAVAAADGARYWRSLGELADDPAFRERLEREFPRYAPVWEASGIDRRRFLQLMGASMALAGLQGCSQPASELIVPYVREPEVMVQGIPLAFATAMPGPDGALGLVVESHMGRPTKVEGNPNHPASLGATNAWAQASILTMYDPDRSQTLLDRGEIATWDAFIGAMRDTLSRLTGGAGLRVLSPPIISPTLARQRAELLRIFPEARWHQYEPVNGDAGGRAARRAFGEPVQPLPEFQQADVVVSLGADLLTRGTTAVRNMREFMSRRGTESGEPLNRLYVVESEYSSTGAAADHRLALSPRSIERFAFALAGQLGMNVPASLTEEETRWVAAVAADLQEHRGRSLIIAGGEQPESVHLLAHAMNDALGNVGSTLTYVQPLAADADNNAESLRELTAPLREGEVQLLIILEGNPVYDAPADLEFARAIRDAGLAVHYGLYEDETSVLCHWHVPAAHYLESWSDARAFDGTAAIVQPLIAPLYQGKTVHEVLSVLVDSAVRDSYEIVRETWSERYGEEFEAVWHQALSRGVLPGTAFEPREVSLAAEAIAELSPVGSGEASGFEVLLLPDPSVGDGRFANNGWLQELPKPLTKLTWGNAVQISLADAQALGVEDGDVVRIEHEGREVSGPVCIVPGHARGCVTCHLGFGRFGGGTVGRNVGFSAYPLLTSQGGAIVRGAQLIRTGARIELARTQEHFALEGRDHVRTVVAGAAPADPHEDEPETAGDDEHSMHHPSLLPAEDYDGLQWGMVIDLSKCTGCNACVVACQAENNVPIVGREGVINNREMHWLRLDTYFTGPAEAPDAVHQPMLCQHCEKAPCEIVCPVAATSHSEEGLNQMTYNRCIGTRYCSNNCPYKVRRFNFFNYVDPAPVLQMMRNPEVTVRSRGVMEKCTYCVQRINRARIAAKKDALESGEPLFIEDGSLMTACQQACPAAAIVFGNINDADSQVAMLKRSPRNYGVLDELNTQPRTTYLARVRNPNPALA